MLAKMLRQMGTTAVPPSPQQFTNQEALHFLFSEIRRIGINEIGRRAGVPRSTIKYWVKNPDSTAWPKLLRLIEQAGGVFTVTFMPSAVPLARRQVKRGRPRGGPGFWKD